MSDLRPKYATIELGGKEYGMLFDLNVIDEIQDKFDISISQLADLMKDEKKVYKVLKFLLTILINEAIDDAESGDPHVDERFIGRKIKGVDIPRIGESILAAFNNSVPEVDDEIPNAKSE